MKRTVLTGQDGRLRLGWRLMVFLVIAMLVALVVTALLGPGIQAGSVAILLGSSDDSDVTQAKKKSGSAPSKG